MTQTCGHPGHFMQTCTRSWQCRNCWRKSCENFNARATLLDILLLSRLQLCRQCPVTNSIRYRCTVHILYTVQVLYTVLLVMLGGHHMYQHVWCMLILCNESRAVLQEIFHCNAYNDNDFTVQTVNEMHIQCTLYCTYTLYIPVKGPYSFICQKFSKHEL